MRNRILEYIASDPGASYKLIIGTDSQGRNGHGAEYIIAVVVLRVGRGGIYFWDNRSQTVKVSLKERMYREALYSLETAEIILELFKDDGITRFDIEIHVDIGPQGETRGLISEIVGMVRGSGWQVRVKPDSFAASTIADRYT